MADNVGLIRVSSPEEVTKNLEAAQAIKIDVNENTPVVGQLVNYIRKSFENARDHQESEGIQTRRCPCS